MVLEQVIFEQVISTFLYLLYPCCLMLTWLPAQGQIGTEMYCVMKGEVEVIQDEEQLGFLPEGSFFGEAGLIDNGEGSEIRSRTVRAVVECELCFLRRDDINTLRRECPELMMKLRRFSRMGERVKPPRVDDVGNPR
jgi:CRP-like cAMP-binding protein